LTSSFSTPEEINYAKVNLNSGSSAPHTNGQMNVLGESGQFLICLGHLSLFLKV